MAKNKSRKPPVRFFIEGLDEGTVALLQEIRKNITVPCEMEVSPGTPLTALLGARASETAVGLLDSLIGPYNSETNTFGAPQGFYNVGMATKGLPYLQKAMHQGVRGHNNTALRQAADIVAGRTPQGYYEDRGADVLAPTQRENDAGKNIREAYQAAVATRSNLGGGELTI